MAKRVPYANHATKYFDRKIDAKLCWKPQVPNEKSRT